MTQTLLLGALVAVGAILAAFPSKVRAPAGWIVLLVGVAVFAIRLQHDPVALPRQGNLLAGVLCLACGLFLVRPWLGESATGTWLARAVLVASPVVMFFGLYSTLAELEEVVILRATDASGETADLRLWIADHEGAEWVTMPRWKADGNDLRDGTSAELVRDGEARCVAVTRFEAFEEVDAIHRLRHEKYAVQRLATQLGIFSPEAAEDGVALRLTPCPASAPAP